MRPLLATEGVCPLGVVSTSGRLKGNAVAVPQTTRQRDLWGLFKV